ncbi:hypothetical protein BD779DRAFT_1800151 [Infundibulicybe gibba]|nr:hypothetical protein BD779DRAFT_1800151 [Infundibulicybe gibba]
MATDGSALGMVELGILFALLTHGALTVQTYTYFHYFASDPLPLKFVISLIWAASSAHVACAMWVLYSITVTSHGVPVDLMEFPLAFPIGSALGAIIHCSVQWVYIYRMYKFGNSWYTPLLCCVLTAYECASGLAFSIIEARFNTAALLPHFELEWRWLFYSFFASTALVDVIIAGVISYYLKMGRARLKRTVYLIDRLIVWTIQTGIITSITAIVVIILYAARRENNAWIGVYIFLTNLYPLALVVLLNGRAHLNPEEAATRDVRLSTTRLDTMGNDSGSRIPGDRLSIRAHTADGNKPPLLGHTVKVAGAMVWGDLV